MITNFEEYTYELSEEEKKALPVLIGFFKQHSHNNPVKSEAMVSTFNLYRPQVGIRMPMSGVRLRKIINYIRSNSILPLIGTSKGYYVSYDREEILKQQKSLRERANSINRCADGFNSFYSDTD